MRGVKAAWANARHLTIQQEGLKHVIFSHPPKVVVGLRSLLLQVPQRLVNLLRRKGRRVKALPQGINRVCVVSMFASRR